MLNRVTISIIATSAILATYYIYRENHQTNSLIANRRLDSEPIIIPGQPFEKWDKSQNPFPCVSNDTATDAEGFFYVKVPKTSSSTLGKITMRIAGREAKRQGHLKEGELCKIYDPLKHHKAFELGVAKRDKAKSFLWSIVRHPSDRVVSHFGMRIKFGQLKPSDKKFIDVLDKGAFDENVELKFLSPVVDPEKMVEEEFPFIVHDILNEYNFIGTYERLYESLVVLSMLIDVDVTDVLFDFLPSKHSRCGSLEKPEWLTSGMQEYLDSPKWRNREKGDYMLYDAIDKSLDMTIEKLGKRNVQDKLEEYLKVLDLGTGVAQNILKKTGCGIPGLHPQQTPYADVSDLFWFDNLSEEDKGFIMGITA